MRNLAVLTLIASATTLFAAQIGQTDASTLAAARAKYDAPFERKLQSFDCAIDFDWKQHWKETIRVGDEGTDEEIATYVQPLHNRVSVTKDDALISSSLTEEQEQKLPHGGMAEGLLKHSVRFSLRTWLAAANNALLPPVGTEAQLQPSATGYDLAYKVRDFNVIMKLTHDMGLESMAVKGSEDDRQDFRFEPGPQGFRLGLWIMGEDGKYKEGNRLRFDYGYQDVGGFQIPKQGVVVRESHHEVWRYTLSDCRVTVRK